MKTPKRNRPKSNRLMSTHSRTLTARVCTCATAQGTQKMDLAATNLAKRAFEIRMWMAETRKSMRLLVSTPVFTSGSEV